MRLGVCMVLGLVAACAVDPRSDELACQSDNDCDAPRTCQQGFCATGGVDPDIDSGTIDMPDADPGAPDAEPPVMFGYVPSNFDPSALTPAGDLVLDCGSSELDSSNGDYADWCTGQPQPAVVDVDGVAVLAVNDFTLASGSSLELSGNRPVIIAAFGVVTIGGQIEADASDNSAGPGGSLQANCNDGEGGNGFTFNGDGGGGGGGGYGEDGADGGNGDDSLRGSGGNTFGDSALVPLVGGCSGGRGGNNGGNGGGGGGAVQISAALAMSIGGVISARGGGGEGGNGQDGGGGGGSGGAVLLEGDTIALADSAALTANGGGGGEGGSSNGGNGDDGSDGQRSTNNPANGGSGGSNSGGNGGDGGGAGTSAKTGSAGGNPNGGGGGGGGAVGRVQIRAAVSCTVTGNPVLSPVPSSSGTGCP